MYWANDKENLFLGYKEKWILVGFGEKGLRCGNYEPLYACKSCLKVHYQYYTCNERGCPNCWETWLEKSAAKIKTRIWEKRYIRVQKDKEENKEKIWKLEKNRNNKFKKIKHIVLSPNKELIKKHNYVELRKQAENYLRSISHMYLYKIKGKPTLKLKKLGFIWKKKGYTIHKKNFDKLSNEMKEKIRASYRIINSVPSGVLLFHPYRITQEGMELYQIELDLTTDNGGEPFKKWDWVRNQGENWKKYVFYSPHFHFVGFVSWLKEPEKDTGWIYKTIEETTPKGKKVSVLNDKDIYRAVRYLLSHTGCLSGNKMKSYVYTGNLSDSFGNSAAERKLKSNGFTVSDDDIIINKISKQEKKAMKNRCKWCEKHNRTIHIYKNDYSDEMIEVPAGKLFYTWKVLDRFFHVHNIYIETNFDSVNWSFVYNEVYDLEIPDYIKLHVLEIIRLKQGKPPPIDFKEYIL